MGAHGRVAHVVAEEDTARALGSGDLHVLATPRLLAWCEAATCAALEHALAAGETSLGTLVHVEHLAATAVGSQVVADASVTGVDGRRVVLAVEAHDGDGRLLARGSVERVVVDAARFLERLSGDAG